MYLKTEKIPNSRSSSAGKKMRMGREMIKGKIVIHSGQNSRNTKNQTGKQE